MKKLITCWLPLIAWCSLIFYLSSIPGLQTPFGIWDLILRKCAHVTEYAVLFLLARRAAGNSFTSWPDRRVCAAAFFFAVLYAASDEYHQSFVPTRGPSVYDVMIDTAGVAIGYIVYRLWLKRKAIMSPMTTVKPLLLVLAAALSFSLSGCGPRADLIKARHLEEGGYFVEAAMKYEGIYKHFPGNPAAPEALYRLGRLYQSRLKLYSQADHYFSAVVDKYPGSAPWAAQAKQGLLTSPDYFPLTDKSFWIEGDSETGGRNMRAEWNCLETSSGTYAITKRISAGAHLVAQVKRYYRREDLELREYADPAAVRHSVVLSYPFVEGKTWRNVEDGKMVTNKIVSRVAAVKVKAGEFANCLKISEENSDTPGSVRYSYYAPGVGWVLTTTAVAGGKEHTNTELLSYRIMPEEKNAQ
jgi:VanZ family protein